MPLPHSSLLRITALGALLIAPPGSSPLAAYQDRGSSLRAQQDQSSYFEEPGRYDDRGRAAGRDRRHRQQPHGRSGHVPSHVCVHAPS